MIDRDKTHCTHCSGLLEKPRHHFTQDAICFKCRKKKAKERYNKDKLAKI